MNKEEVLDALRVAAVNYAEADKQLGHVCGVSGQDPIACTVFALKRPGEYQLPHEAITAATWLEELTRLHGVLVQTYGMNNFDVRRVWLPILNR